MIAGLSAHRWHIVFWAVAAVPVVVVAAVPTLVVQDGGLHLANAVALRGLVHGWWPDLLAWRATLPPNSTLEIALAFLTSFLGPDAALKTVTIVGLVGFAAAVYALTRAAKVPVYAGIPLLVFEMHFLVVLGFLGFVWSVPLGLGAVAVALARPRAPNRIALGILVTAAWLTHFVPAIVAGATVVLVVFAAQRGDGATFRAAFAATTRALVVPLAPAVVLTAVWIATSESTGSDDSPHVLDAAKNLADLSTPLVAYVHGEYWIARLFALTVYAVAAAIIVRRLGRDRQLFGYDGVLAAATIAGVAGIVLPEHSGNGGGYLATRMGLLAAILLVLWICVQLPELPNAARWSAVAVSIVVAAALPIVRMPALQHLSSRVRQIDALADCLPLRSTYLQLNLDTGISESVRGIWPLSAQAGTLAVRREALDVGNESGWYPFYFWRFRDPARADRLLQVEGSIDAAPPDLDLDAAPNAGIPDAIVLYGRASADPEVVVEAADVLAALERNFRLVRRTSGGDAELWLRTNAESACSG